MRTTIDIPSSLLQHAVKSFGVKTKRDAVVLALKEHVGRLRRMRLHEKLRGRFPDLSIDVDSLRQRETNSP